MSEKLNPLLQIAIEGTSTRVKQLIAERDALQQELKNQTYCYEKEKTALKADLNHWKDLIEGATAELKEVRAELAKSQEELCCNDDMQKWKKLAEKLQNQMKELSCPHCGSDVNGVNWKKLALGAKVELKNCKTMTTELQRTMDKDHWYKDDLWKLELRIDRALATFPPEEKKP
jgi:uncharacterized membrane-anchored protein YhcB (DUF1043 family)